MTDTDISDHQAALDVQYWCQDCGLKCQGVDVPFIEATLEQPEEGGCIESDCCGGEVQEVPYHTCDNCGEEHETLSDARANRLCRFCRLECFYSDLCDPEGFYYQIDEQIGEDLENIRKRLIEYLDNFKRKELTR